MTSQRDFVEKVIESLNASEIFYMLSGSMSSSFHGQPRATNDADIVIDPTKEQLLNFVSSFGDKYYVNQDAALQALENNSMFNIIDIQAGWKADLIIRKKTDYGAHEFSRKKNANVMGINLSIVSPEDSILSKLQWSKASQSQSQLNDAAGVLTVQWDRLDFDYLHKWAKILNVEDSLKQISKEVEKQK
jgi:hypothetical protein